jgi:hypothetical protein
MEEGLENSGGTHMSFRPWPAAAGSVIFLSIFLMSSCSDDSMESGYDQQSAADLLGEPASPQCGTLEPASEELNGLALGLSVVDDQGSTIPNAVELDCSKDVAIFVHGWSVGGTPTEFEHADLWQKKGFQTECHSKSLLNSGNLL